MQPNRLERSCPSSPGRMTYTLPLSLGATQAMGALGGGRGWLKEQNPTKEISSGNSRDLPRIGFGSLHSKDEKPISFKTRGHIANICRLVQKRVCLLLSGVYPKAFPRADQKVSISIPLSFWSPSPSSSLKLLSSVPRRETVAERWPKISTEMLITTSSAKLAMKMKARSTGKISQIFSFHKNFCCSGSTHLWYPLWSYLGSSQHAWPFISLRCLWLFDPPIKGAPAGVTM